jgi:hypothetical protein
MNKACLIMGGVLAGLWASALSATADFSVSGLGVLPYWRVGSGDSVQFDQALNLSAGWTLSDRARVFVNLQSGVGDGRLGFQGPAVVVTDVGLDYDLTATQQLSLGSFDMPFGQEVERLTNNGSLGASGFVLNPLLYTALAGPAGTLNTVGVMLSQPFWGGDSRVFVSNGTGENAVNDDRQLAYGFQWTAPVSGMVAGISAWQSHDRGDLGNTDATSIKADMSAYLLDVQAHHHGVNYHGYLGQLWFGDGTDAADMVTVGMLGAETPCGAYTLRARVSFWMPEDNNGDASGISSVMPDPSMGRALGDTPPLDRGIVRYQLGVSRALDAMIRVGVESFLDQVQHGEQAMGVLSYLSVEF